jgi:hypothetical protein
MKIYTKFTWENSKTLVEEIKGDISEWRNSAYPWIRRPNTLNMSLLPNLFYRFNEIPI